MPSSNFYRIVAVRTWEKSGGNVMRLWQGFFCSITVAFAFIAPASAGEPVGERCRPHVTATASLAFDDIDHRRWYDRFWTGRCQGLGFCLSGSPNWNETAGSLESRSAPGQESNTRAAACELGELVGHEWARDNAVRCIDTADVRRWGRSLTSTATPLETLGTVRRQAEAKLSCSR